MFIHFVYSICLFNHLFLLLYLKTLNNLFDSFLSLCVFIFIMKTFVFIFTFLFILRVYLTFSFCKQHLLLIWNIYIFKVYMVYHIYIILCKYFCLIICRFIIYLLILRRHLFDKREF